MVQGVAWEYRVLTIGGALSTKDEQLEEVLNEWGEEGWEVVSVYPARSNARVTVVAKRPLTVTERRRRSLPG